MSEMEFHIGKAKEIYKEQNTFEEKVEELSKQTGLLVKDLIEEDYGDDYKSMVYRGDYVYVNKTNKLYKLIDDKDVEEEGYLSEAHEDEEGLINYKLRWYNGGASFDEVFEKAIEKIC